MVAVVLVGVALLLLSAFTLMQWFLAPQPTTTTVLKIGFSTDWEYGSRKKLAHKLPIQALGELEKVVAYYNEVFHPDIVIGGGDYIESTTTKPEKAKAQLEEVNTIFERVEAPRFYALGNHDMRSLSKDDVKNILGITESHSLQDVGEWRLVIFDTNFNPADESDRGVTSYVQGYVNEAELEWLEQALQTDRPTIIFSHHSPIDTLSMSGNLVNNIYNAEAVRAILEKRRNVVAVVSGHTPRPQYREVNGVHYFVADTLVNAAGLGAFATIEARFTQPLGEAEIVFEHYGLKRESYRGQKNISENQLQGPWLRFREKVAQW